MTAPHRDDAEREAREDIRQSLVTHHWPSDTNAGDKGADEAFARAEANADRELDTYRTAVRATRDAEVLAMVEGMWKDHGPHNCTLCHADLVCHESWLAASWNAALDALAARLDTPTTEEG